MPTYEYTCENGHEFEEFQSIVAPPIEICPICGVRASRKISGGTGLIFKGTGFYLTDYARKSHSGESKSSSSSAGKSAEVKPPAPKSDSSSGSKDS